MDKKYKFRYFIYDKWVESADYMTELEAKTLFAFLKIPKYEKIGA